MLTVPRAFQEEVADALRARLPGKLALLADEAKGLPWEPAAAELIERTTRDLARWTTPSRRGGRTLLFTGHQVDAPGRQEPRFPPDKEAIAHAAIRDTVEQEARGAGAVGFAGAASGGDILFHEGCAELGIPTKLYLAIPADAYVNDSVEPAGPDWVRRFEAIHARFPFAPILSATTALPEWLRDRRDYSIWQRNNLWMLHEALAEGAENVTLIALWNGKAGDGPGGTADMISIATASGASIRILDTNALFGLTRG